MSSLCASVSIFFPLHPKELLSAFIHLNEYALCLHAASSPTAIPYHIIINYYFVRKCVLRTARQAVPSHSGWWLWRAFSVVRVYIKPIVSCKHTHSAHTVQVNTMDFGWCALWKRGSFGVLVCLGGKQQQNMQFQRAQREGTIEQTYEMSGKVMQVAFRIDWRFHAFFSPWTHTTGTEKRRRERRHSAMRADAVAYAMCSQVNDLGTITMTSQVKAL